MYLGYTIQSVSYTHLDVYKRQEVKLSTMTTSEKSMDVINQVAITVPPNSEKIIMVRT